MPYTFVPLTITYALTLAKYFLFGCNFLTVTDNFFASTVFVVFLANFFDVDTFISYPEAPFTFLSLIIAFFALAFLTADFIFPVPTIVCVPASNVCVVCCVPFTVVVYALLVVVCVVAVVVCCVLFTTVVTSVFVVVSSCFVVTSSYFVVTSSCFVPSTFSMAE